MHRLLRNKRARVAMRSPCFGSPQRHLLTSRCQRIAPIFRSACRRRPMGQSSVSLSFRRCPRPKDPSPMSITIRFSAMGIDPTTQGYLRHANTHRTRSVDYAIVLDGEIDMLLDDSEIHVKAGDVLVQQGTNHAW